MSQDRFILCCDEFITAVRRLEEALQAPYNDFVRDAAIQRFEFCWELGWKLGKAWLARQGIEAGTPRSCWEGLLQAGILAEGNRWSHLQRLRNLTSHTYDEALAQQVYDDLRTQGYKDFASLASHAAAWKASATP